MTPENWYAIGTSLAMCFAGWQAWRANRQTKSTGNGFANTVLERLARIESKGDQNQQLLVKHLADHAGHDLTRKE